MTNTIEELEKELENKSMSECIDLVANTIQEKNTPNGITMSQETINDLVTLLHNIAQYIKEDLDEWQT